jgi:hypothetical protein
MGLTMSCNFTYVKMSGKEVASFNLCLTGDQLFPTPNIPKGELVLTLASSIFTIRRKGVPYATLKKVTYSRLAMSL